MITRFLVLLLSLTWLSSVSLSQWAAPPGFQAGASRYTPEQLHEMLVGTQKSNVVRTFGRMPDRMQGYDWFYEGFAVYSQEQDQYYHTVVVCFSRADGLVWQVVCYPN